MIFNIICIILLIYFISNDEVVDKTPNCPSSSKTNFKKWICRLETLSYNGGYIDLRRVDFSAIANSRIRILRIRLSSYIHQVITKSLFDKLHNLEELDLEIPNLIIEENSFQALQKLKRLSLSFENKNFFFHRKNNKFIDEIIEEIEDRHSKFDYNKINKELKWFEKKGIFFGLHNLNSLKLICSDSNLNILIDGNIFAPLKNLRKLIIIANKLSFIQNPQKIISKSFKKENYCEDMKKKNSERGGLFKNLEKLKVLKLFTSFSFKIGPFLFDGLRSLEDLEIIDKGKKLHSICKNAFFEIPLLKELKLELKLDELPSKLISKNTKLRVVQINSLISNLDENFFVNNSSLISVNLSKNMITKFPKNVFKNNREIRFLNLSENPLSKSNLSLKLFQSLNEIIFLDLDNMGLEKLYCDQFKGMEKLRFISLNKQKLSLNKCISSHFNILNDYYGSGDEEKNYSYNYIEKKEEFIKEGSFGFENENKFPFLKSINISENRNNKCIPRWVVKIDEENYTKRQCNIKFDRELPTC